MALQLNSICNVVRSTIKLHISISPFYPSFGHKQQLNLFLITERWLVAWLFRRRLILSALNTFLLIHLSVPFTGYHINKSQIDRSIRKQHHYWTHHTNPPFNWRAASTRFHYRPTVHPCNKSSAAGYGQRNTLFSGAAGLKGNCTCGDSWRTIRQEHEYSCDSQLSCPGS